MVLAEVLGVDEFRERVKIYATDVDEEALGAGPAGRLHRPRARRRPEPSCSSSTSSRRRPLRLPQGPAPLGDLRPQRPGPGRPISRIDLLVCRNTLMYFNAETQARILAGSTSPCADGGVLFLGKAEMLLSHGALFAPVDLKRRIFRKVAAALPRRGSPRDADASARSTGGAAEPRPPLRERGVRGQPASPQVVVDRGRPLSRWPTAGPTRCSGLAATTSAARSGTWSCPTGRWSCARYIEQAQVERRAVRVARRRVAQPRRRGRCARRPGRARWSDGDGPPRRRA